MSTFFHHLLQKNLPHFNSGRAIICDASFDLWFSACVFFKLEKRLKSSKRTPKVPNSFDISLCLDVHLWLLRSWEHHQPHGRLGQTGRAGTGGGHRTWGGQILHRHLLGARRQRQEGGGLEEGQRQPWKRGEWKQGFCVYPFGNDFGDPVVIWMFCRFCPQKRLISQLLRMNHKCPIIFKI